MKESESNQLKLLEAERRKMTSEAIDLVRFPLAIMVVFIHTMSPNDPSFSMPTDYGHLSWMDVCNLLRSFGTHVFSHIAVPTFFLISGYLFYKRLEQWNWTVWKEKMNTRCKTLIIPYLIWCLLYVSWNPFIIIPIKKIGAFFVKGEPLQSLFDYWETVDIDWLHVFWDSNEWGGTSLNWLGHYVAHNTSPALVPFWFMRDLIVVIILSPLVYWLVKKMGLWFIFLIALFHVSGVWPDIHGLKTTTLLYFSLGAWFTLYSHNLCSTLYKYRWAFYLPYLILLPLMVYWDGQQTYGGKAIYIFTGVLSALCFCYYLVSQRGVRKNPLLVNSCFLIFAFHTFILSDCGRLITRIIGTSQPLTIMLCYILQPSLAIIICVAIYYSLHRWLPSLCKLLTGGR